VDISSSSPAAAAPSSSSPAAAAAASQASAPASLFKKAATGEPAKKARAEKPVRGGISEVNLSEMVPSLAEDEIKSLYKLYKDTTKSYDSALLAMSPEEKADSSLAHIFVWLALLECEQLSSAPLVVAHKETVWKEVETMLAEMVKQRDGVRLEPINEAKLLRSILERQVIMFRDNIPKLMKHMRVEGQATTKTALPVLQFVIALMVNKGNGTVPHNLPPRGKQEHMLQRFFDQM
jgi:hypothetical protein